MQPLSEQAINDELGALPGWRFEDDRLKKSFELNDFRSAISFIVRLAFFAEKLGHHPELHNAYNKVDVTLTTHDAGDKVTDRDFDLARAIESFSWV